MANVTTTTAANFIPEIWSSGVKNYLERKLVFEQLVDSSLSSLTKSRGDTFHIPKVSEDADAAKSAGSSVTFAANTHGEAQLVVDQHRYSAKLIEDLATIQANPGLMEKELSGMGYSLAKTMDAYIESKIESASTNGASLAGDNVITSAEIRTGMKTLMESDVPMDECSIVVSPALYTSLLGISDFVDASKYGEGAPAATGNIGRLFGLPVFTSTVMGSSASTDVEVGYIIHPSAVSFARQLDPRVQSEYSVGDLGTKVVADVVYGAVAVFEARIYEFRNP